MKIQFGSNKEKLLILLSNIFTQNFNVIAYFTKYPTSNFRFKVPKITCNPLNKTTEISREGRINSETEVRSFCILTGMSRIRGRTILQYSVFDNSLGGETRI